jgi:hypothetical protein
MRALVSKGQSFYLPDFVIATSIHALAWKKAAARKLGGWRAKATW